MTFSGLFWRFPWAIELSKSFYWHFSIAICLYSHEVSGKIIFPDTFPKTYLNSTCTCHFLHHKVSGKYVSGKIFPDSWKNVMILAANHVNDYLDAILSFLTKNTIHQGSTWGRRLRPEPDFLKPPALASVAGGLGKRSGFGHIMHWMKFVFENT